MLEVNFRGRDFGRPVLGQVNVSIAPGDRICLLGPSGIGKTTLMNAIAGLDKSLPDSAVSGRDNIRIGYLFQEHRLLPWRTLKANLALVGASSGEVDELLTKVGLAGYSHYFPDQLSLGMARRAALARCLAVKPDLLLLDEPFASLDAVMANELKRLINRILDDHPDMAMICVTHDEADVDILANRLWYLDGKPARLMRNDAVRGVGRARQLLGQMRELYSAD